MSEKYQSVKVTMRSVEYLRELISDRLTAAAGEIFTEFEKTIVQYQEEIDRQRRLLDVIWKPHIPLQSIELPQSYVCENEKSLIDHQPLDQERNSMVDHEDPEPPQINDQQEELCTSLDQSNQELPHIRDCNNDKAIKCLTCEVCGKAFRFKSDLITHDRTHMGEKPYSCGTFGKSFSQPAHLTDHEIRHTELPQSYVCENEKTVIDHQPHDQERNPMVDHEDPEPPLNKDQQEKLCTSLTQSKLELPQIKMEQEEFCTNLNQSDPEVLQIKKEQEELCTSQEEEQLGLKQETDFFVVTPAVEESDHSEPKPNGDQLLFHISCAAESPDQEGGKDVDSGSPRCIKLKPRDHSNNSHSSDVVNAPLSERRFDNDKARKYVPCEVCGKGFRFKSHLIIHHRTHTGEKPYSCGTCGKSFTRHSSLTVHMRCHTGEKPYSCETCGKRFTRQSHLAVHMRCHTGERPYSCNTCGKSFMRQSHLTDHMRCHTGEKPYSCNTCGKSFSQRNILTDHMRCHTGEKPYVCNTCGKRFSRSSHHHRHMAVHKEEKPFSCGICGKCFCRQDSLVSHMRSHTGEKSYSCKTCGQSFSHSRRLKSHMRSHDPETFVEKK